MTNSYTIEINTPPVFTVELAQKGARGLAGKVSVGTTTTGEAGSDASVNNTGTESEAILNFTIPRGDKGDVGDQGVSGTVEIGTTTTLDAGTSATVENVGTAENAILNFGIPRGADATNPVESVNGETGVVVLDKSDVGLGNVDNTSDANKPISTATQTALNSKADSSTLTSHTSNTSNPHSVTKTQVGLSNVPNTDCTTTANITDSSNKRFLTDAQLAVVGNTSGTNTGDETNATIKTKLGVVTTTNEGYVTPAMKDAWDSASGNGITALTGDVTASGGGSAVATLANSGATAGTYYNPTATVDAKGRVTSIVNTPTWDTSDMPLITSIYSIFFKYSKGSCWDMVNNVRLILPSNTTKTLGAWAEGSGPSVGSLDTGTKANSTWYYVFLIGKTNGTTDILTSLSSTSPTMPSGYVYKRRIGSVYINNLGEFMPFKQFNDTILYDTPINNVDVSNQGTSETFYSLTIPIIGNKVFPIMSVMIFKTSTNTSIIIGGGTGLATPSNTLFTLNHSSTAGGVCSQINNIQAGSGIYVIGSTTGITLRIVTHGFIDRRMD